MQSYYLYLIKIFKVTKVKVIHVIEALGGGVYSYFCDLTKSLGEDKRVETIILYNDKRSEIIPENVPEDFHHNVRLILLDMEESISPIKDWQSIKNLAAVFEKENPDVIHLHSSKAGVLGKIAARISGSKALLYYTPHGYSFLRKDISFMKALLFKTVEKVMASFHNCTTIACGDTELLHAKKLHKKVQLIRNGIPYESIKSHLQTTERPKITIGILGRITFARNPILFNSIAIALPEVSFKWIGDGILRDQITAPNIQITGWFMNRKQGLDKLNEIDIYLQTSLWEGLPIAVLEAMTLEKPVIATNVIGNKDIVKHGKTGFLIGSKDEAIAAIIKLNDKSLREKMGHLGSLRVREKFNSNKNFQSLVDLYLNDYSNKY